MARLRAGFLGRPTRFGDGFVQSNSNIVQHILDQVADAIDKPAAE
jgi:hypothetical protein